MNGYSRFGFHRSTVWTAMYNQRRQSMREYDLIADWYANDRGRSVGVAEALAVAATLPANSRILDVGCGNGVPITQALVKTGHGIVGLDNSAGILAGSGSTCRGTPVVRGDVWHCPFENASFDAAISWGLMFHLARGDQAAALANMSRVLKPGAPFLFTAAEIGGADDNGIAGTLDGVTFHYYAVASYRTLIGEHGLILADVHGDPGVSTHYLARKTQ